MLLPLDGGRWRPADVRARIVHEAAAIRHLHHRQSLRIQAVVLADDAVQRAHTPPSHTPDRAEGSGMIEWHRPVDIVPQGGRVRPVAADRLERFDARERSGAADQNVLSLRNQRRLLASGRSNGADRSAFITKPPSVDWNKDAGRLAPGRYSIGGMTEEEEPRRKTGGEPRARWSSLEK